jgi:hypothetical protein
MANAIDGNNQNSPSQSRPELESAICSPCSEVAALIVSLNDPTVCEALQCLLSRAERVEDPEMPEAKFYALDLLTVPRVAAMLRKSDAWVRRHKKELGGISLGGCGRGADLPFARAAIEKYILKHAAPELKRLVS